MAPSGVDKLMDMNSEIRKEKSRVPDRKTGTGWREFFEIPVSSGTRPQPLNMLRGPAKHTVKEEEPRLVQVIQEINNYIQALQQVMFLRLIQPNKDWNSIATWWLGFWSLCFQWSLTCHLSGWIWIPSTKMWQRGKQFNLFKYVHISSSQRNYVRVPLYRNTSNNACRLTWLLPATNSTMTILSSTQQEIVLFSKYRCQPSGNYAP